MGWKLSIKKDKYRIWSTVVDAYITEWATKEEILDYIEWFKYQKFKEDVAKERENFPSGWINKETGKFIFDQPHEKTGG